MESDGPALDKHHSLPYTPMSGSLQTTSDERFRSFTMMPRKLALVAGSIAGLLLLKLLSSTLGDHKVSEELAAKC